MPRAIWKGAVSFGLVNVPVRLYAATGEHDIRFHQVHRTDGGRIRMKRTCSVCGEEIAYDEVAKGYESPDGKLVVLDDADFDDLPVASGREIDVLQFVPAEQVDPVLLSKPYYLEPESRAAKPYALLREALVETDRMAVVKIAIRQRESIAVLRVRDKAIVLQTMLWPDEVRAADFEVLETDIELRPQELKMAASLVESLAGDFHPEEFEDEYAVAVKELVDARLEDADTAPAALADEGAPAADGAHGDEVVDLLTALQRSVERARGGGAPQHRPAEVQDEDEGSATEETAPGTAAKGTGARGTAAKGTATPQKAPQKAPAKKTAARKTAAKKTTSSSGSEHGTAKKTTTRARKSA